MTCDFADLVQNGFCTHPVAPLQGSIGPRSCTSPAASRLNIRPPRMRESVKRTGPHSPVDRVFHRTTLAPSNATSAGAPCRRASSTGRGGPGRVLYGGRFPANHVWETPSTSGAPPRWKGLSPFLGIFSPRRLSNFTDIQLYRASRMAGQPGLVGASVTV
jgi:hypothetical protein